MAKFMNEQSVEPEFIVAPFLARGLLTLWFSPRGAGKTVLAYGLAVQAATRGTRVLLLDRDNPPAEIRRRMEGWGAHDLETLRVLTRERAPSLTDPGAWADFPIGDFDLVIIDSLDSTTEGVGEQDSARPSRALAPILDLVRQPNAPAVLCLGNTTKAALHGRGSGVIEDRADIIFEVRDATNYTPSGDRIWYEELPESGAAAYASRARRKADSRYLRLAFIPSKYRVGTQPLPLLIEVRFDRDPWELEDVTGRIVGLADSARAAAARERQHTRTMAVAGLCLEVQVRAASDRPMLTTEAVEALMAKGLVRSAARRLIQELVGTHLKEIRAVHDRGKPRYLVPLATPTSATPGENETHDEPRQLRANEVDILAGSEESGRPESISPNGRSAGLGRAPAFPPDSLTDEIASRKCLRCNRTLLEFREHDSDFECDLCKFTQANDAHGPTTEMPADLLTRTAEERSTKERSQS